MNDFLVQLIVVAVLANVVLLVAALVVARVRRPARHLAAATPGPSGDTLAFSTSPAPVAVAPLPPATTAPATFPAEAQGGSSSAMRPDMEDAQRQRRFYMPQDDEYPTSESVEAFLTAGQRREGDRGPMIDDQTGLETGIAWEMAVDREEKRVARYAKPVTVVVAELDRLDALAARLGQDNADRLVPPVALTLRRLARAADLVARTGHSRFQVLMPETDEVRAINYVERVRDACDMWLDASAVSVRLVVGWASAGPGVSIRDATRIAEQRMHADRARTTFGRGGRTPAMPAASAPPTPQSEAQAEAPAAMPPEPDAAATAPSGGSSSAIEVPHAGPATGPTV